MKFPTANEIGEVRGDLRSARECYMASIGVARGAETQQGKWKENSPKGETFGHKKDSEWEREEKPPPAISFLLEGSGDLKMTKPVDKLDEVPLKEDYPDCCIKISTEFKDPLRGQILALLWQYADVIA